MYKTAQGLMSKNLMTIHELSPLIEAWRLMKEKTIRHLPVVNEKEDIIGILSDRDLQRAMRLETINEFQQEARFDKNDLVKNFMSFPVYVVSVETTLKRVAMEMLRQKISAFLVEDEFGSVRGIITTDDILKAFVSEEEEKQSIGQRSLRNFFIVP